MRITKIVETRINIDNINDMFCSNYDDNIIKILKKLYVNKCFKSVFILDIIKIITRSGFHCKNKVLDGGVYIDISFEISGMIYEKGEVIHDCKIIQINNDGTMYAKSEYASIHIKNVEGLVLVKENDQIPVIVHIAGCNIFEEEISVLAIPFMPVPQQPIIYNITSNIIDIDNINELFSFKALMALETNLKELKKSNKAVYKFFTELIYPYKALKSIKTLKYIEITLENLENLTTGDLLYTGESYLDNNTYSVLTDLQKKQVLDTTLATIIDITKQDYILYMLNVYFKRITTLLEFLELYDTTAKIKEKTQVWALYNLLKQ